MKFGVIVPSHKRPFQMEKLFTVLDNPFVTVEYSQLEAYRNVVPDHLLIPHPEITGMGGIRKWICDWAKDKFDAFAMLDDDLRYVDSLVYADRMRYFDSQTITRMLHNMGNTVLDLDLPVGTFAAGGTLQMHYSNCQPFHVHNWATQVFVINSSWLDRVNFSADFEVAEDDDFSLQCFEHGRIVLRDNRFRFEFGHVGKNIGGLRSRQSMNQWHNAHQKIKRKWKKYVRVYGGDESSTGCRVIMVRKDVNRVHWERR
jgi:hypothetical protein